jgi:DNA polymerase II small subunit
LPDDVDIYTIMGNHDTVRLAEPQPVIKEAFKQPFSENVHFAGNPATFDIEGVKFLLYHGMSLNPFTDRTPGLDIHEPTGAMELMLRKRHLAPMYGMNVRLAPEHEDYLAIEEVPDVLHTGHVHTFGVDTYKNVLMVNTGCWQYQTDFQRKLNVEPDVGIAPVIDLSTLDVDVVQF